MCPHASKGKGGGGFGSQVYPLDIKTGALLTFAAGAWSPGAFPRRACDSRFKILSVRELLAAITCWSSLNSPTHSQQQTSSAGDVPAKFSCGRTNETLKKKKVVKNKWIKAAGNLKMGVRWIVEQTQTIAAAARITLHMILETSIEYKWGALITFHRLVLNLPSNVCVDLTYLNAE